jgi:LPXTG-motif cell wall-anchored protein
LPPWVLPVSVVGGAALIGVGVFIFVKRKGKR